MLMVVLSQHINQTDCKCLCFFWQAEAKERNLHISCRWQPWHMQYQQILAQLKTHHVERLQLQVEDLASAVLKYNEVIKRRDASNNRREVHQYSNQNSKRLERLGKVIEELQSWHGVPCTVWLPPYDAAQLSVDSVLQGVPWAMHWRVSEVDHAKQRFLCACEEMALVKREAGDAEKYYRYYVCECERVSAALGEELQGISGGVGQLAGRVIQGKLVKVVEKKGNFSARLSEMVALNSELRGESSQEVVHEGAEVEHEGAPEEEGEADDGPMVDWMAEVDEEEDVED